MNAGPEATGDRSHWWPSETKSLGRVVHLDEPEMIVAARKDSPLIIGIVDEVNVPAEDA